MPRRSLASNPSPKWDRPWRNQGPPSNSAKRITVSLAGWQLYLLPGDPAPAEHRLAWHRAAWRQRDWRSWPHQGTGLLVQVNAGVLRSLDQRKAEAALADALAKAVIDFLRLRGLRPVRVEESDNDLHVYAESTQAVSACVHCASPTKPARAPGSRSCLAKGRRVGIYIDGRLSLPACKDFLRAPCRCR